MFFVDDDAIYDVIMDEPVGKWGNNNGHDNGHEISRDPLDELSVFSTY